MSSISLIIAEDHPIYRDGLRQMISRNANLRILAEARDGPSALRLATDQRPDVLLLDVDLPGMNGIEVLRRLRDAKCPARVILLTMYKDPDVFNESIRLGAKGYVLKESAADDILAAIDAVAASKSYVSPALSDLLLERRTAVQNLLREKPELDRLTPAERRILQLIACDRTSKEIAEELGLSPRTVDNHRNNICNKLGLHGSHSLLKWAYDNKARIGPPP